MKKLIKLLRDNCVRLDDKKPFIIPENELIIEFESVYNLSNAFITLSNGSLIKKFKYKKEFEVPSEFLFVGELLMTIEMYLDDKKVKSWYVMPIKILETDGEIIAFDWLSSLENRIKKLEDAHEIIL